jgi:diguanylate cyclase (GGDEF)-like protein/PAS domain S-box-containing protein
LTVIANHKNRTRRVMGAVVLFAVTVVATHTYLSRTALRMAGESGPLVDASKEVKYELTLFHLWFEELVSGDESLSREEVFDHLTAARRIGYQMLEDRGETDVVLKALVDPALRADIGATLGGLDTLEGVAKRRLAAQKSSRASSDMDRTFDAIFTEVVAGADRVEAGVQAVIAADLARYQRVSWLLGLGLAGLSLAVGVLIFRYERRGARDLLRLSASEVRFRTITHLARDAIVTLDHEGRVTLWNEGAGAIFGYSAEVIVGSPVSRFLPGRSVRQLYEASSNAAGATVELLGLRSSGESCAVELSLSAWAADGQSQFVLVLRDITERKRSEARLEHRATHDPLTGLPNRAFFEDRLADELAAANRARRTLGVLFLDLDHFKPVNDEHGHDVGDELLVEVGRRLLACLRGTDLVARLGGDEFTVILPELPSPKAAELVAAKIVASLSQPFRLGDLHLQVGASVGISVFPDDAAQPEALVRAADTALYASKASGRSCFRRFRHGMETAKAEQHGQGRLGPQSFSERPRAAQA